MMEMPSNFTPKSFWERKEGTTGMLFGVILLIVGGYALFHLLPFIISLLANALTAMLLLVAVVVVGYILMDKRFWNLLWYFYKSAMRAVTRVFVEIDPIGILKNYVQTLRDNASNMNEQIANLRGQMRRLKETIDANEKTRTDALKMAGAARKENNQKIVALKARKAGRLEESNMTLTALYTKMEVLYRVLTKMYETCLLLIEDLADEVSVKDRERSAIKASYSAFKSAMKIVNGDKDKKEIFDQTMEFLADDYGKKLGEIEHFMEMSSSVIESIDIQNGVYEEDALKKLDEWEKKSDSILLGSQKQALIEEAKSPNNVIDLDALPQVQPDKVENIREIRDEKKYNKYFNN